MTVATTAEPDTARNGRLKLSVAKTVTITQDDASDHRDMASARVERPFSPSRVDWLKGRHDEGLFLPPLWVVATLGGVRYRMNGQHTSTMLSRVDPFPEGQLVHIEEFDLDTEDDMILLFRQFDSSRSVRTPVEVVNAFKSLHDNLVLLKADAVLKTIQGISYGRKIKAIRGVKPPAESIGEIVNEKDLHGFIQWWSPIYTDYGIGPGKMGLKNGVAAAAFKMFAADEDQAKVFWRQVLNGESNDTIAPVYKYNEYLTDLGKSPKKRVTLDNGQVTDIFQFRFAAVCWANFRKKEAVRQIAIPGRKDLPKFP